MSVLVKWTVTMGRWGPITDPYTGIPTMQLTETIDKWPMSREFPTLTEAQAFIDAAPGTCGPWEIDTDERGISDATHE